MNELVIFYPEGHEKHFQHRHPERPERVEAIKTELIEAGIWDDAELVKPVSVPEKVFYSVHKPSHYENLKRSSKGHVDGDVETFLTEHSFQLALDSAGGAAAVAKHVWENDSKGFALCRPPGHHATFDHSMGFCLINNIAVAAEYLIQEYGLSSVAIIDLDVHHGNGTQDIFYDRPDIFFFSIHQIPLYPMSGFINEKGNGDGLGYTMNIPLPPFSGNNSRLEALETLILPKLSEYQPEIILISVGYDAHWQDPLSQQLASVDNYAKMIKSISDWADENCSGRLALFLEGGYDLKVCSTASLAICNALLGNEWDDPLGESDYHETDQWKPDLERTRREWKI
jgi:acetoin utilization deacetylase AcuC-like enzyme